MPIRLFFPNPSCHKRSPFLRFYGHSTHMYSLSESVGSNMAIGKPTDDPSFLSLWFLASRNSTLGSKGYGLEWVLSGMSP